jgi:PAS domain S-box-containing protein
MAETVYKIGLFSDRDKDFIVFSGLCNNIASLNITLRVLRVNEVLQVDRKFFEIPVYIINQNFFEDAAFKETLQKIKESNAPVLCLLENSNLSVTRKALDYHADFWLYSDALNSPILQSTLKRAEHSYRLKEESQYLKRKFHESEKRFLGAIRSRADAVIVIDHNLLIRFINPVCEEQFGISSRFIGQQFPYALKKGQISEIDLKPFTGKTKIVETIVTELMWENESCLTISLNDITEQRRVENELITFRHVIHLSPMPILITDSKGLIIYANKKFSEASEYPPYELIGNTPRILKSGKHEPEFYKNLWDTINSGQTWYGQVCNKTKSGRLYWEKQLISPVKNNKNEIMFFICMRIDDLEKKKAEKAKARADTLKSVQELAGGIAHEFSQPLQVLSISMALMEKEIGKSEYFLKADKMIKRIIKLVDNLKSITTLRQQEYLSTKIMDIKASSDKTIADSKVNRILVIDDEREILDSLIEILKIHGYESSGVSNGIEALQAIEETQFKLIICDIDMPGMAGTELFRKIKETGFNGYFVFMTGYEVDEELDEVVNMADGFLTKPFQIDQLKGFVDKFFIAKPTKN